MIIKILAGLGIFLALFIIFVVIFLINKKTKIPDDCPKDLLNSGCAGCMLSCSARTDDYNIKEAFLGQSKEKNEEENIDEHKGEEK